MDGNLQERLARTREDVARAARAAGRDPAGVALVAVSKFHPAQTVALAHGAGQTVFGESYVQEALAKMALLRDRPLCWHLVGGLQSNKAKYAAGRFALIHSLDSVKLARALHKALASRGEGGELEQGLGPRSRTQDVLIQVSLAGEEQKSGVAEADLPALAEEVLSLPGLSLQGLMVLPPLDGGPEAARPFFARLRELRDRLARDLGVALPHLSMGMTDDFVPAIQEGATLVRIGTRIFGSRPGCPLRGPGGVRDLDRPGP